jgi:prepilin-type processing-associated H-X9-DG protein
VFCQNNYRQLQIAWLQYVAENNDRLPPNEGPDEPRPPRSDVHYWWAQGNMDFDNNNPQNIDAGLLVNPDYALLGNYSVSAPIYRCPSDRSKIVVAGAARDRVRSVTMNEYLGGMVGCWTDDPTPNGPQRMSQLPRPVMTFAFIDHHPDSIGSPQFRVDRNKPENLRIKSWPGTFHGRGATVTFADGHVELHRWRDARTLLPVRYSREDWPPADQLSPNNPDLLWLQERTVFP